MPTWSPDGQWIAFGFGGFFGARETTPAKLMMVRADGSQQSKDLTKGLPNSGFPTWSPDGKQHHVSRLGSGRIRAARVESCRRLDQDVDHGIG